MISMYSDYPNEVAASALFQIMTYKPLSTASKIKCPVLLVSTEEDNLCTIDAAEEVVKVAGDKCQLLRVPGGKLTALAMASSLMVCFAGHFDLYPGHRLHKESLDAQLEFLKKHVPI
jgi:fermentation-respiration switch protein FrsA (DUF1100 family)